MGKKIDYNSNVYCLDIETTTLEEGAVLYLGSIAHLNLSENFRNIDSSNIEQIVVLDTFFRTYDDLDTVLYNLNARNMISVVYVHNLGYEWTFIYKNSTFCHFQYDDELSLYTNSNEPLFVRCGNVEFRDSLKLLNCGLRTLGNRLGYEKLEIDYQDKVFSWSDLEPIEYEYNKRDVFLTLLGIVSEWKKYAWIKDYKDGLSVYTYTGFTRRNNLKNARINKPLKTRTGKGYKLADLYLNECRREMPRAREDVLWLQDIFSGGYVAANPSFVGIPCEDVQSYDFKSSYPASTLERNYPFRFRPYERDDMLEKVIEMDEVNYNYNIVCGKVENGLFEHWRQPCLEYFMATLTLSDLRIKSFWGKSGNNRKSNQMPLISESKTNIAKMGFNERRYNNVKVINGKLFTAHMVEVKVTAVDLLSYHLFYDFKIERCEKLWIADQARGVHEFVVRSNLEYLKLKVGLGPINVKAEHGETITKEDFFFENYYLLDEVEIESLLELQKTDRDLFEDTIHELYLMSKNHLNAQYGINVERLLKEQISMEWDEESGMSYNAEEGDYSELLRKGVMRNFITGLHITAYSRLALATYTYCLFVHTDAYVLYWDTDSIKVMGDAETVKEIMAKCRRIFLGVVHKATQYYKIGTMEYEGTYKYFCTWGSKKYITSDGEKIHCTIAGVSKRGGSDMYTYLFHVYCEDNFELLCKDFFRPNIVIDSSVTGKLGSLYENNYINDYFIDKNGKGGYIHAFSGVRLVPADYTILATPSRVNCLYIYQLKDFQPDEWEDPLDMMPCKIYREGDKFLFEYAKQFKVRELNLFEVL